MRYNVETKELEMTVAELCLLSVGEDYAKSPADVEAISCLCDGDDGYIKSLPVCQSFVYGAKNIKMSGVADGYFEKNEIDTVFVFGGTNDSWADAPLGKFDDAGEDALYSVLPAIRCFLGRLRDTIPDGRIIVILNTEIKVEITDALESEGEAVGATVVRLSNISKVSGHPESVGMKQIYEQVKTAII